MMRVGVTAYANKIYGFGTYGILLLCMAVTTRYPLTFYVVF